MLKPPALFHLDGPALGALTAAVVLAVWLAMSQPVGRVVSILIETAWLYVSNTRG